MKTSKIVVSALFVIAVSFALVGCGGGGEAPPPQPAEQAPSVDPATFGSLTVTANFDGEAPEREEYDASGNPECSTDTIQGESVIVNDNGTLRNVVVAVENGPAGLEKTSVEPKTIDQKNCKYVPHVVTLKTGQTLNIKDSDQGMHNVRGTENGKQLFNHSTFQGQTLEETFDQSGAFHLVCDVHNWMSAWIYVTENGRASVTSADGSASLSDLPPGDYTLTIWHEEYGSQTEEVTIGEKEDATLDVTFFG